MFVYTRICLQQYYYAELLCKYQFYFRVFALRFVQLNAANYDIIHFKLNICFLEVMPCYRAGGFIALHDFLMMQHLTFR